MAEGGRSVVKLQAENIDLQQQLNEANESIEKLKQALSSNTVHVVQQPGAKGKPNSLDELHKGVQAGGKGSLPADVVSAEEYDKVEADLEDALEREENANAQLEKAQAEIRRLKGAAGDLEKQLADAEEAKALAELAADQVVDSSSNSAASNQEITKLREENAASERRWKQLQAELERKVATREQTIEEVQQEVIQLRKTTAEAAKPSRAASHAGGVDKAVYDKLMAEKSDAMMQLERAQAERNIAVRVKDGALQETATIRADVARRDETIRELKKQLAEGASSAPSGALPPRGDEPGISAAAVREKDAMIVKLQMQVADLSVKAQFNDEEGAKGTAEAVDKLRKEFAQEREKLEEDLERAQLERALVIAERDKALEAGKRAFLERNRALDDAMRLEKLERIQAKAPEPADRNMTEHVFQKVMVEYDQLVGKLEEAQTAEQTSEVMHEILFDYEKRIWHLNNDLMSLRTIVDIKEEDAKASYDKEKKFQLEEIQLLQDALKEARDEVKRLVEKQKQQHASPGSSSHRDPVANNSFGSPDSTQQGQFQYDGVVYGTPVQGNSLYTPHASPQPR